MSCAILSRSGLFTPAFIMQQPLLNAAFFTSNFNKLRGGLR
jgi:hypothetical protein